ncbi:hypothetical protein T4C_7176, partial [Trichinella pseudospiralis]
MFILLRYFCDGKLGCSSGGKVLYCHSISENRYVVSYNSALQHHPKITDTSDTEEEKVHCNLATSLTLHYFHPNCRFTLQTYSILDVHLHYYNTIFGNSEALYKKLLFRKLQLSSFIISLLKFHIKHIT